MTEKNLIPVFIGIWVAIILFTILRVHLYIKNEVRAPTYSKSGFVISYPKENRDKSMTYKINEYYLRFRQDPNLQIGDSVKFNIDSDETNRILYDPKIEVKKSVLASLLEQIKFIRYILITRVDERIGSPRSTIALGMTIGQKEYMDANLQDSIRKAGVTHLLVVSGYNINLLISFVLIFFARAGKQVFLGLSILFIIILGFFVGFDPPVVRALLMGFIGICGVYLGRVNSQFYSLILSSILMIIVFPWYLWDVSFQMSFLATFGLIYIERFTTPPAIQALIGSVLISILIIPLTAYYFGEISILSPLSNILVVWTAPIIMALTVSISLIDFFVIELILASVIDYFLLVCNYISELPFGHYKIKFTQETTILYYALVFFLLMVVGFLQNRNKSYRSDSLHRSVSNV